MRVAVEDPTMDAIYVVTSTIERLRLALEQGSLSIRIVFMLLGMLYRLWNVRRLFDQVGDAISTMDVRSEDDRTLLREVAQEHQRFVDVAGSLRDRLADWRLFKVVVVPRLDALVIKAGDIAETAALGASSEFANLVKEDLERHNAPRVSG